MIKRDKKLLGICLGAQLIAKCLGGMVSKNTVYLTEEGKNNYFFKNIPEKFITFHWHNDTFTIPAGAKHIAYSKGCKNQAFVCGKNIVGLQFHPEVTYNALKLFVLNFSKKKDKYVQSHNELLNSKIMILQNNA